MYVFNRQRNLFPHVLQVCKSFLRCIDVIEIFKFRLLFTGPASQRHWRADPTLETWIHGTQYPSSTRLQTFNGTNHWIQPTHPTDGYRPGRLNIDNITHTVQIRSMTAGWPQMYPIRCIQQSTDIIWIDRHCSRWPTFCARTHPTLQAAEGPQV